MRRSGRHKTLRRVAACLALAASAAGSIAAVIRVPEDNSSIHWAAQTAGSGDTILVAMGEYYDQITVPPLRLWILGDVPLDTGDFARPIIDPSLAPDSIRRGGCLTLVPGSLITVERMRFRNRLDMSHFESGGVFFRADTAAFRFCQFDSTYRAVYQRTTGEHGRILIEQCGFRWTYGPHIFVTGGPVFARDCKFFGTGQLACVQIGEGSMIENCHFSESIWPFLVNWAPHVTVRSCVFGPCDSLTLLSPAVALTHFAGVFENNVLTDLHVEQEVVQVGVSCDTTISIRGNLFYNCARRPHRSGGPPLRIYCDDTGDRGYVVEHCTFSACSCGYSGVQAQGRGEFRRNRFENLVGTVACYLDNDNGLLFRENLFYNNGVAMFRATGSPVDARFNYWGDSTGPYNRASNPNGQGDVVGDNIMFAPWYSDTSFLAVDEPNTPLPTVFTLRVFPNPFNAQATFVLKAPDPGIYSITLFDLLGRQAAEVFRGPVAYQETVRFDAAGLPSGIYFARLWDVIERRPLAWVKVALVK